MRLIVYLNIISFCVYLTRAFSDYANVFIPLIKRIRSYYSSSSVFFLYSRNHTEFDSMEVMHIMHTWSFILQREHITTLSITIDKIQALTRYYNNISRPLVVVFLEESSSFHEFSYHSRHLKMSSFAWFVTFMPSSTTMAIDGNHCYTPQGNPFHVTFDTELLVLCLPDTVLREWYSVDGKTMVISNLANWNHSENNSWTTAIELFTNLSLYERRNDLKGAVLRGVTVKNSILARYQDDTLKGYFGMIIKELQNALNFTVDIVAEDLQFGSFNITTNRWTGAISYIVSGTLDIGLSDFSMTNNRMDYVDYLIPIVTTRSCLYLRQRDMFTVKWFAYFKTFNFSIWMSLFAICLIAICIIVFIRSHIELCGTMHVIYEECLRMLAVICQQGLIEFPRHSSLRIAYFSMLLSVLVISAAYSASLICFLAASVRNLPFRTIDELVEDGTYSIILERGSADYDMFSYSKDPLALKIMKLLKPLGSLPLDLESGFKDICDNYNLAFYSSYNPGLQKVAVDLRIPCKISCLSFGCVSSFTLILSKDSQYTSVLNYYLQKLLNSGLLNRYKHEITYRDSNNFQPVGFGSVASALLIFVCGAILALLILIVEICWEKCRKIKDFERPNR